MSCYKTQINLFTFMTYCVLYTVWVLGLIHSASPIQLNVKLKRWCRHGPPCKRASRPYLHWAWYLGLFCRLVWNLPNKFTEPLILLNNKWIFQCEKAFTVWFYHVAKICGHSMNKIQTQSWIFWVNSIDVQICEEKWMFVAGKWMTVLSLFNFILKSLCHPFKSFTCAGCTYDL